MITQTWIHVGLGVVLALIVATSYFGFRAQRAKLSRQLIWPFIAHVVMWSFFALMFFDGMIRVSFLAAIFLIYAPSFYWILKTPHDGRAG
jgi:hypothetical protein